MEVQLIDIFGDDKQIVDTARVSYGKEASNYTDEQNEKLIKYLVKHGHTSPFRHTTLRFRIKCPIYVERQLFKHQVGISVNSISGRYVDFSDSYYKIPYGEWRKQSTSSKQGSEGFLDKKDQAQAYKIEANVVELCKKSYEELIELGVSKEQARSILPLNLETEFIWTGTLLAFIHLCNLRLKPDTQAETRSIVQSMLYLLKQKNNFEISLKSFEL